jgi:hypothetical protein
MSVDRREFVHIPDVRGGLSALCTRGGGWIDPKTESDSRKEGKESRNGV